MDEWRKVDEVSLIVSQICEKKIYVVKNLEIWNFLKFFIESYYLFYVWTQFYKSQLFLLYKNNARFKLDIRIIFVV